MAFFFSCDHYFGCFVPFLVILKKVMGSFRPKISFMQKFGKKKIEKLKILLSKLRTTETSHQSLQIAGWRKVWQAVAIIVKRMGI